MHQILLADRSLCLLVKFIQLLLEPAVHQLRHYVDYDEQAVNCEIHPVEEKFLDIFFRVLNDLVVGIENDR